MFLKFLVIAVAIFGFLAPALADIPNVLTYNAPGLIPEGFKYSNSLNAYVVGSIYSGQLRTVNPVSGTVANFTAIPQLTQTFGVLLDETNNRLLVCNSKFMTPPGTLNQAGLAYVDATSGDLLHYVDLTPAGSPTVAHLANDVALDLDGNAFITDTQGSQIWKVDTNYHATMYVHSTMLSGTVDPVHNPSGFGADGIVFLPGMLLVNVFGSATTAALLRISHPVPTSVTPVTIYGGNIAGADGMLLTPDGASLFITGANMIYQLQSSDGWMSATIVASHSVTSPSPTAITYVNDDLVVSCSNNFNESGPFYIEKVTESVILDASPDSIELSSTQFLPESFTYIPDLGFVVGSFYSGQLATVDDAGQVQAFTSANELATLHTTGVHADLARNQILVCASVFPPNASAAVQAVLVYVDATTSTVTKHVDLTHVGNTALPRWAGDVTVDNVGNAYVTDMTAHQVYQVTPAGVATVYVNSPLLGGVVDPIVNTLGIGADGIAWTSGYLLVGIYGNATTGGIMRVSHPQPSAPRKVAIYGGSFVSADGIEFDAAMKNLYVVSNAGFVYQLQSQDGWLSAQIVSTARVSCTAPTAITWRGSDLYASCVTSFSGTGPYTLERVTPNLQAANLADSLLINEYFFQPTSIVYSPTAGFLLNSQNLGTVSRLNDAGMISDFSDFGNRLNHSTALYADDTSNTLYVAATRYPPTNSTPALYIGNLSTGAYIDRVRLHNLDAGDVHYLSGLTQDDDDQIYVTESMEGIVVRVDTSGNAVTYIQSASFVGTVDPVYNPMGFGITGIVYFQGALIVAKRGSPATSALFRIPVVADPAQATFTTVTTGTFSAAQTMVVSDGRIYLSGGANLFILTSFDGFASVATIDTMSLPASVVSVTLRGPYLCMLNSELGGSGPYSVSVMRLDEDMVAAPTANVVLTQPYLLPESFVIYEGAMYVGSLYDGQVHKVHGDGTTELLTSTSYLVQTAGLKAMNGTFYICSTIFPPNAAATYQASLLIYDSVHQQVLHNVDLTGIGTPNTPRMANDVAVTPDGTSYVSDSFGAQIWKVNSDGTAARYLASPLLQGIVDNVNTFGIGANGIEYVHDALFPNNAPFLLVVRSGNATNCALLKVSLSATPTITVVPILNGNIGGADGMVYVPSSSISYMGVNTWLYVTGGNNVYQLYSNNNWQSAVLVGFANQVCNGPTSVKVDATGTPFLLCAENFNGGPYQIIGLAGKLKAVSPPFNVAVTGASAPTQRAQPLVLDYSEYYGFLTVDGDTAQLLDDFGTKYPIYGGTNVPINAAKFRTADSDEILIATNAYVQLITLTNGIAEVEDLTTFASNTDGVPVPQLVTGMTVDEAGNAYIIDALSSVVWSYTEKGLGKFADLGALAGNCPVPNSLQHFGPIGIVHVPNALLVAVCGTTPATASLLRVELADISFGVSNVSPVYMRNADGSTSPTFVTNVRAMVITPDYQYLFIMDSSGNLQRFTSTDNWLTITLSASGPTPACAWQAINWGLAVRGDDVYEVCPDDWHLDLIGTSLTPAPLPTSIAIAVPGLFPEGVTYIPNIGLVVSSYGNSPGTGHVHVLSQTGNVYDLLPLALQPFQTFGLQWISSGTLLVAQSIWPPNPNAPQQSGVAIVSINPASAHNGLPVLPNNVDFVDLTHLGAAGGPRLALDVAMDAAGKIYVTDALSAQVLVVEGSHHNYQARVFASDSLMKGVVDGDNAAGLGINGIAYHPGGFLLASRSGNSSNAALLRISTTSPPTLSRVRVTGSLAGADGLRLADNATAYLVGKQAVYKLQDTSSRKEDPWSSAKVVAVATVACNQPTTLTLAGTDVWVACIAGFTTGPYTLEKVSDKFVAVPVTTSHRSSSSTKGVPVAAFVVIVIFGIAGACVGLFYHYRFLRRGDSGPVVSSQDYLRQPMLSEYDSHL